MLKVEREVIRQYGDEQNGIKANLVMRYGDVMQYRNSKDFVFISDNKMKKTEIRSTKTDPANDPDIKILMKNIVEIKEEGETKQVTTQNILNSYMGVYFEEALEDIKRYNKLIKEETEEEAEEEEKKQ